MKSAADELAKWQAKLAKLDNMKNPLFPVSHGKLVEKVKGKIAYYATLAGKQDAAAGASFAESTGLSSLLAGNAAAQAKPQIVTVQVPPPDSPFKSPYVIGGAVLLGLAVVGSMLT